jgi:hypothetical protein
LKGRANIQYSPEQEELLDSGLRMLAHMIAETHLHRVALRKTSECTTQSPDITKRLDKCHDSMPLGDHDE